jgi:hypothetical protein
MIICWVKNSLCFPCHIFLFKGGSGIGVTLSPSMHGCSCFWDWFPDSQWDHTLRLSNTALLKYALVLTWNVNIIMYMCWEYMRPVLSACHRKKQLATVRWILLILIDVSDHSVLNYVRIRTIAFIYWHYNWNHMTHLCWVIIVSTLFIKTLLQHI